MQRLAGVIPILTFRDRIDIRPGWKLGRLAWLMVPVILMAVFVAACGSDDSAGSAAQATEAAQPSAVESATETPPTPAEPIKNPNGPEVKGL